MRSQLPIACALWLSSIAPLALAQPRHGRTQQPAPGAERAQANAVGSDPATRQERDKQARIEFEHGRKSFDEGDYRGAWGFFHNAYRLSGRAQLLFNIGQTADRLGKDSEALTAFRMYLERLPNADNRRDVENRIHALEERVSDAGRVPSPPGSEETAPQPTAAVTAQPATPPPAAEPPAPPPAPKAAGPRPTRQGFYLRVGLGLGIRRDGVSGGTDGTVSGLGFAGEFAAGFTVMPGFVVGGAIYSDLASSPSFKANTGLKIDFNSAHLTQIGAMADWYVRPKDSGFHFQAALTFAVINVDYKSAAVTVGRDASGIGAVLGVGYEWPIADEIGIGVLGRVSVASLSDESRSHGVFAPSVLATLTWY